MAENNDEILNVIGDMSFLPQEAKDDNLGRSFPKLRSTEKLFRLVFCSALLVSVITYLVFLFVKGTEGYFFNSSPTGNYGIPYVFTTYFSAEGGFAQTLGIFTLTIMMFITLGGVVLSFLKPNISKIYNCVILALGLWVVVFFSSIFSHAHSYSVSSNYAIMFFIFGAVFADLALPFYLLQKKVGLRSVFHSLLAISAVFEALAILLYGMVTLG